jgi:hypothetical protein
MGALEFGWKVAKHVKSQRDRVRAAGHGSGQRQCRARDR